MAEIKDHGHWDILHHLIQERADVNKIDSRTRTPLYQAALMGAQNAVKALIEADANLEKLDKRVWSCVFFCGGSVGHRFHLVIFPLRCGESLRYCRLRLHTIRYYDILSSNVIR